MHIKECLRYLSFVFLFLPKRILLLIYRGIVLLKLIPIGKSLAKDNTIMYPSSFEKILKLDIPRNTSPGSFYHDWPADVYTQPTAAFVLMTSSRRCSLSIIIVDKNRIQSDDIEIQKSEYSSWSWCYFLWYSTLGFNKN